MPNFNGKGPFSEGPMTGRGRGCCCKKQSTQIDKPANQPFNENMDTYYKAGYGGKSEKYGERERRRFRHRNQ